MNSHTICLVHHRFSIILASLSDAFGRINSISLCNREVSGGSWHRHFFSFQRLECFALSTRQRHGGEPVLREDGLSPEREDEHGQVRPGPVSPPSGRSSRARRTPAARRGHPGRAARAIHPPFLLGRPGGRRVSGGPRVGPFTNGRLIYASESIVKTKGTLGRQMGGMCGAPPSGARWLEFVRKETFFLHAAALSIYLAAA
jgi:hypothetical protein